MKIIYRLHALQRMFERNISEEEINVVLTNGKIIETYPNDKPYPSRLILGYINERPIHVVIAESNDDKQIIVITVYEPNKIIWDDSFERRRK